MVEKILDYWKIYLGVKKMNLGIFTQAPQQTSLQVLNVTLQAEGNYSSPQVAFFFKTLFPLPTRKGGTESGTIDVFTIEVREWM